MQLTLKAPPLFGVTKRGQAAIIPVAMQQLPAVYLGSGRFTSAYKHKNDVFLYVCFGDKSKDILAHCHNINPTNHFIPSIEFIGKHNVPRRAWDISVYKTKMYHSNPHMKDLKPSVREIVGRLKKAHRDACIAAYGNPSTFDHYRFNQDIASQPWPDLLATALADLTVWASNFGDGYLFDNFRLPNLATNNRGQLVLLDPMFDSHIITKDNKRRADKWQIKRP